MSDEKQEALKKFLQTDEAVGMKDNAIAKKFGVHHASIGRARKKLATSGSAPVNGDGQEDDDLSADGLVPEPHQHHGSGGGHVPDSSVEPGLRLVKVSDFDLDAGTRIRPLNEPTVVEYMEALQENGSPSGFGEFGAMWVEEIGRLVLYDGFHRHEAIHRILDRNPEFPSSVQTIVKVGTLEQAIGEAFRANRKRGLPLSAEDRADIIVRVLETEGWSLWNDSRIAKFTGENRIFIGKVRKEWYAKKGQEPPEKTLATSKTGKVFEQSRNRRGADDAAESDEVQGGDHVDDADKQKAVDDQYLMGIPARASIHPDLLEEFDLAALARRDLNLNPIKNWLIRHRVLIGEDHPLIVAVEKVAKLPQAVDVEGKPSWVACTVCEDDNGLSTGQVDGKPCKACKGLGYKIPGLR